jgi:hypothetical protein
MFWKVYAVVYLVLVVVGLPPTLSRLPHIPPIDFIDMAVFAPIAVAGLWSSAYRHISLPKNTWKILLFVSVFWRAIAVGNALLFGDAVAKLRATLGGLSARMDPAAAPAFMFAAMAMAFVVGAFLTIPPLIALYRNAYGDESLLQLMSPSSRPSRQTVS